MHAAILNAGSGAWAFEALAQQLSASFQFPISETPVQWNYLLGWDSEEPPSGKSFIPFEAIEAATDKRAIARLFGLHRVPAPETHLLETEEEVQQLLKQRQDVRWLLKWPVGCGAAGHRFVEVGEAMPTEWPRPFVVQKYIEQPRAEVFRLYVVAGQTFGWNARRFSGENESPFVAHARGARYEAEGEAPAAARAVAEAALRATGLWDSFGCADLLRDENGEFWALEVNTDGRWMHVDRDVPVDGIGEEINRRLARAFREWCGA